MCIEGHSTYDIITTLRDAASIALGLREINKDLESAGVNVKHLSGEIADLQEVLEDWMPDPTDYEV